MPGLLEDAGPAEQATTNQPEQQAPDQKVSAEEVSPAAKSYLDKAVGLLYGDNFEKMVAMFKQHGEQGFHEAMSIAVNGILERLEADEGELPVEILAEVGMQLVMMLTQDMVQGGVIAEVNRDMLMNAIGMTLGKWGQKNPGRADPKELQEAAAQADAQRGVNV